MTFTVNQHVFWLNISMYDSIPVNLLDCKDQLGQVYPSMFLAQPPVWLLVHDFAHVTTWAVVCDHVEVVEGLESIVELCDKLMIDLALDFFFSNYKAR